MNSLANQLCVSSLARFDRDDPVKSTSRRDPRFTLPLSSVPIDPASSEEQRLVAEYHIATERYTAAVGELTQHRATMGQEDYTKLLHIVEDARNECERVRHALSSLHEKQP